MISVYAALGHLFALVAPLEVEEVPLAQAAGRGLAGARSAPRVLDLADGGRERERRVVSAGDAMRSARAVARVTARRPNKLREIPRIKRGALKPPGGSVHLNAIHARGFVL